jgi:hypothetical protein
LELCLHDFRCCNSPYRYDGILLAGYYPSFGPKVERERERIRRVHRREEGRGKENKGKRKGKEK